MTSTIERSAGPEVTPAAEPAAPPATTPAPAPATATANTRRPTLTPPADKAFYRRQSARRQWAKDGLQVLAWVSLAVPLALWLAQGGLAKANNLAGVLTAVGIVAGLLATSAMVLMLWLTARVPFIDHALGQDRATALHSRLGQLTFGGLIAHGLFLIAGYAAADKVNVINEFTSLWPVRDFALAIASIGLLAAVSASSVVVARRRLPFEAWHVVHLLTYGAVLTALPHQFSMGGLFAEGASRWYWAIVWAATFFVMLRYRIVGPLFTSLDHRLTVSSVRFESPDVATITLTGRRLDELHGAAGQYFHWRFLAPGLWWHQHPFSLSAAPTADTLRITVRNLGEGTARLLAVRPGTRVAFEGPYGVFSDRARTSDRVVMVGFGIGIAPVRALLEETAFAPGRATVILRASTDAELFLLGEVEALAARRVPGSSPLSDAAGATPPAATCGCPSSTPGRALSTSARTSPSATSTCAGRGRRQISSSRTPSPPGRRPAAFIARASAGDREPRLTTCQ